MKSNLNLKKNLNQDENEKENPLVSEKRKIFREQLLDYDSIPKIQYGGNATRKRFRLSTKLF